MKNVMQLKAIIKTLSKEKNISAQLLMQNFMLERLLEQISVSQYKQNFILKGGFLIAAIVGVDSRATMDMDLLLRECVWMSSYSRKSLITFAKSIYMMMLSFRSHFLLLSLAN